MKSRLIVTLVLALLLAAAGRAPSANAQPAASYDLNWYTVDGGGGASAGGAYTLTGTLGQPDAGTLRSSTYTLAGGFWPSLAHVLHDIFLPLVRR